MPAAPRAAKAQDSAGDAFLFSGG